MHILINGQEAAIKAGSSFEYVQENRLFTEAEGYSLEIEFPLKGCLQNQKIFGLQTLISVQDTSRVYQCVLSDVNFHKSGYLTITAINDVCVKAQFLEGASVANFNGDALDNTYINEVRVLTDWERNNPPTAPVLSFNAGGLLTYPWVNNGSGNMQNKPQKDNNNAFWTPSDKEMQDGYVHQEISYQIGLGEYLYRLSKATGITIDISKLPRKWYNMVIANACPGAWHLDDICYALPKWTIREFLEQLALLTGGVFNYDYATGAAVYQSVQAILEAEPVDLDTVVDSYEMEVSDDAAKNYAGACTIKYAECSHRMWKYYDCQWLVDYALRTGRYVNGTERDLKNAIATCQNRSESLDPEYWNKAKYPNSGVYELTDLTRLYYDARTGRGWMVTSYDSRRYSSTYTTKDGGKASLTTLTRWNIKYREVNRFRSVPAKGSEVKELKIVPVWLDDADNKGQVIFLEHGEFGDDSGLEELPLNAMLSNGEQEENTEYLDKLYVGFIPTTEDRPADGEYRRLTTHGLERTSIDRQGAGSLPTVNPMRKYKIKFLSKALPDVNAIYHIRGRRFLCSQLSMQFTPEGKSDLVKGEFFMIDD